MKKITFIFYNILIFSAVALINTFVSCGFPTSTKTTSSSAKHTDERPSYLELSYEELKKAIEDGEINETDKAYKYFQKLDSMYGEIEDAKKGFVNKTVYYIMEDSTYHHKWCEIISNKQTQSASITEAKSMGKTPCKVCYENNTNINKKSKISETSTFNDEVVYITPKGKKYHRQWCRTIKGRNCQAISKIKAENKGKTPCKRCYKN